MTITYKTEGKCILTPSRMSKEGAEVVAVLKWIKGGGAVTIFQGSSGGITLDKAMLLQLAAAAESIAEDLQPNMNSLPRPA